MTLIVNGYFRIRVQHDILADTMMLFSYDRIVYDFASRSTSAANSRPAPSFSVEPLIFAIIPLLILRFPIMFGSSLTEENLPLLALSPAAPPFSSVVWPQDSDPESFALARGRLALTLG